MIPRSSSRGTRQVIQANNEMPDFDLDQKEKGTGAARKLLTNGEVRQIAANVAKLTELLRRPYRRVVSLLRN
jgi:hypothetical protein